MRKIWFFYTAATLVMLLIIFFQGDGEKTEARMVPILIGFKGEKSLDVITEHGGTVRFDYSIINAAAAYVPEHAIDDISNDPGVEYVEMDETLSFAAPPEGKGKPPKPQDPPSAQETPWGVARIGAETAWATSRGAGVKVAVLDSGIDYSHTDLQDNYAGGVDLWNGEDPMDDDGHGTMVAGVIAARDNDKGVVGVAPEARLYAVRIGGHDRYRGRATDWATLVAGLDWCVANGMDVINDSVWGSTYNETYESALQAIWNGGEGNIVYIAAAGNQGRDGYYFFSGYGGSSALVGATESLDAVTDWSSRGHFVDLCAPGASVLTTKRDGDYGTGSGTSFAAPHVAGVAALILATDLSLTNGEVLARLYATAERLESEQWNWWNERQGWGLVDAAKAVNPPAVPSLQNIDVIQLSPGIGEVGFYTRFAAIGDNQYNLTFDATWTNVDPFIADLFWDGLARGSFVGTTDLSARYGGTDSLPTSFTVDDANKDIIIIEAANWVFTRKPNKGTFSVSATSTWNADVTLTVEGYGTMTYDTNTGRHTLSVPRVTCPYTVWVNSDLGGRSYAFTKVARPSAAPATEDMPIASEELKEEGTILLQNMPNPSNPETWMPFKLSEAERVVIRIYSATGQLVRTLDLGQKDPGAYISKEKAAYWDGKSESGENVASGTYFYLMEAGQFRDIKKLIIMR